MQQLRNATIRPVTPKVCARDLLAGVHGVMRFIRHEMRGNRRTELSVPQFRALVFLRHADDASLSAMAEHVGLSLPAASRLVDALVRRGFLVRQSQARDRRRVALSLTARGSQVLETALAATERAMARRFQALSQRDLSRIRAAMRTLDRVFSPGNGEVLR